MIIIQIEIEQMIEFFYDISIDTSTIKYLVEYPKLVNILYK